MTSVMAWTARQLYICPQWISALSFYFALVLGWLYLRRFATLAKTSLGRPRDDGVAGRPVSATWVPWSCSLGGSAYQYGILAAHWYWIGAIPDDISGTVMMPFIIFQRLIPSPVICNCVRFGTSALSGHLRDHDILCPGTCTHGCDDEGGPRMNINFSIWVSPDGSIYLRRRAVFRISTKFCNFS